MKGFETQQVYKDSARLMTLAYEAQFCMTNADRIIYGNDFRHGRATPSGTYRTRDTISKNTNTMTKQEKEDRLNGLYAQALDKEAQMAQHDKVIFKALTQLLDCPSFEVAMATSEWQDGVQVAAARTMLQMEADHLRKEAGLLEGAEVEEPGHEGDLE